MTPKELTPAQKIAVEYMSFAKDCASKFCRKLPKCVDKSEVYSDAYVGLVRAANAFNPAIGRFPIYATKWIFGAMKDGISQRHAAAFAGIEMVSIEACLDIIHSGVTRQSSSPTGMANIADELEAALIDQSAVDPADAADQSESVESIRGGIADRRYGRPSDPYFSVTQVAERFGIDKAAASRRLNLARHLLQAIHEDAKNPCQN